MKAEDKAVMKRETSALEPTTWAAMKEQATMLVKSGFLPTAVNTPEKALAVALAGQELGIGIMESFRSINVIQGKPTISPQLMLALANRTGELENIEIVASDEKCVINVKRKGRTAYTNEFGVKEAKDLGLIEKDNYKKQKKTMFQWRALAANLRVTFPDVVLGLYTPEELGAEVRVGEAETMEVIEATPAPITITRDQGQELYHLARAKGIDADALLKFMGVTQLRDVKVDQVEPTKAWIASHPTPPNNEEIMKAYDAEVEAYIRAGVTMDGLGDYVESLPFASDMAAVAGHLGKLRATNKPEDLAKVIKVHPKAAASA